jgi:hypothetical protein
LKQIYNPLRKVPNNIKYKYNKNFNSLVFIEEYFLITLNMMIWKLLVLHLIIKIYIILLIVIINNKLSLIIRIELIFQLFFSSLSLYYFLLWFWFLYVLNWFLGDFHILGNMLGAKRILLGTTDLWDINRGL